MPPPVFEDWEVPIYQRVSAGLSDTAPPVPVDRELVDGDVLDLGGGAEITQDRARTVASFHRLADLEIETARFGHGEPIPSGAGDRIREVAASLMP